MSIELEILPDALAVVDGWLGIRHTDEITATELPEQRPARLGLGAKFLPHKLVEQKRSDALEKKIQRSLKRKRGEDDDDVGGDADPKESSDDEESGKDTGAKKAMASRTNPLDLLGSGVGKKKKKKKQLTDSKADEPSEFLQTVHVAHTASKAEILSDGAGDEASEGKSGVEMAGWGDWGEPAQRGMEGDAFDPLAVARIEAHFGKAGGRAVTSAPQATDPRQEKSHHAVWAGIPRQREMGPVVMHTFSSCARGIVFINAHGTCSTRAAIKGARRSGQSKRI